MKLDDKGMATAELLFVTLIALVIIGSMLSLVSNEINQQQIGNLGEPRMAGENIAAALNTVYNNGHGYSVTIHLDPDPSYSALIQSAGNSSNLTIFTSGKNVTIPILPKRFNSTYTLSSGNNYQISNVDGTIYIIKLV
ncbi:hypothetical protein [Methanobacterium sp. BAmetb5]|jgi:hypothetical protein|uniref:hypothetical protein n=1 Tax=Methanobacterium sp. BAmetb5 TaxID=2025351 RepID=UPI000E91434F|nr:hypothetical protein [Methanobacterium sp. BAmetb5]AXV39317.1 MAG: hypothetical protein CIT02_02785 [Methanobacterium sp. BAmetb5]